MTAILWGVLLASRWAVVVLPADPADAELADNVAEVMEATFVDKVHVPLAGAEELRSKLNMQPRDVLDCAGRVECLAKVRTTLEVDRLVVCTVSRGVGDERVLNAKMIDTRSGKVLQEELTRAQGPSELVAAARDIVQTLVSGPKPPPPAPRPERRHSLVPLVVGGGGVVVAAAGAILLVSANGQYNDLEKQCAPYCPPSRTSSVTNRAAAAYVLVGVGAAAIATGAVLWIWEGRESGRRAYVAPTFAGLVAGGSF